MNTHTDILSIFASRAFGINPSRIPPEIEAEIGRRMLERESVYHSPAPFVKRAEIARAGPPKPIEGWNWDSFNAARQASVEERRAMIPDLVAKGYTTRDIANAFGLTTCPINKDLAVLGLRPKRTAQPQELRRAERLAKLREHWDCSDAALAIVLGVHRDTVRAYRRQIRREDEAAR